MKITKIMTFDAAHQLPNEKCYGKCANMHGHTYKLEVTVEGEITTRGWVMNFKDLKKIMMELIDRYDHTLLNDHEEFGGLSTAENMVQYIWDYIEQRIEKLKKDAILTIPVYLYKVRLWETPTSHAELEA